MRALPTGDRVSTIGRCELLLELASHDTTVFLARRTGPRGFARLVTVRYVGPFLGDEAAAGELFLRDAQRAATVMHPGVLPIHDLGAIGPGRYMVTDYVEGGSLADLLRVCGPAGIPPAIALAIAADWLDGLSAIHRATDEVGSSLGLVHGRLSPRSVIVGLDGRARLADLALARLGPVGGGDRRVESLRYGAPEVLRGALPSPCADAYSAGLVLYEALGGVHPIAARAELPPRASIAAALDATLPLLSLVVPDIPHALAAVIARATAPDPALRPRSIDDLARSLERVGPRATTREVSVFVERALRHELDARREAVRAWTEEHDASMGPRPRPGLAKLAASRARRLARRHPKVTRLLALVGALAGAIGGGTVLGRVLAGDASAPAELRIVTHVDPVSTAIARPVGSWIASQSGSASASSGVTPSPIEAPPMVLDAPGQSAPFASSGEPVATAAPVRARPVRPSGKPAPKRRISPKNEALSNPYQ
jgi:serine/threonine-protein kinase